MDAVPETLKDVVTPCFVVDLDILKQNCQTMIDRCKELGVTLRPHMKTHKTLQAGELMTNGTKRCIEVSTVVEAEFFADGGFDDILYTTPPTGDKIPRLKALSERLDQFHLLVDSDYAVDLLEAAPLTTKNKQWSVYLKIECGYERVGLEWDSDESLQVATRLHNSDKVKLHGIYGFDGKSYNARQKSGIQAIGNEVAEKMSQVSERLEYHKIDCAVVATGSTPTCSVPGELMTKLTEFHPGNYVFYDAQQAMIGSCTRKNIAGRVATRVIGHYPQRNQLLVDCGFLALSHDGKDMLPIGGYCVIQRYPNLRLSHMTQEIGFVEPVDGDLQYENYPIGSILFLYPYHSCPTAAMHPKYYIHQGDKIVDVWKPCRGW